jgi:hypothetical protein
MGWFIHSSDVYAPTVCLRGTASEQDRASRGFPIRQSEQWPTQVGGVKEGQKVQVSDRGHSGTRIGQGPAHRAGEEYVDTGLDWPVVWLGKMDRGVKSGRTEGQARLEELECPT